MSYFGNLFDHESLLALEIDNVGKLITADTRRLFGSYFVSSIDTTYQYNTNVTGSGTVTAALGTATIATGTTANSSSELITKGKARSEYGKVNNSRFAARFTQTGDVNNISYIRMYIDSLNEFGFRLNGTTFEVYVKRNGSVTAVANGSLNGNGKQTNQTVSQIIGETFTVTNFYVYEIRYIATVFQLMINNKAIHTFRPTTQSLITALYGNLSVYTVNSNGGTTNCGIELLGMGAFQFGGVPNNPLYYNANAVAETRTLKTGGGTLHQIIVGKKGGAGDTITVYDNTAGSGTIITVIDLQNVTGNQLSFNSLGVNFSNGLTYVSTGTTANFTFLWE